MSLGNLPTTATSTASKSTPSSIPVSNAGDVKTTAQEKLDKKLWDNIKNANIVEQLLKGGANPNCKKMIDGVEWSPLAYAVYYEYAASVEKLLAGGARTKEKDAKDGKTEYEITIPIPYKGHKDWTLTAYSVKRNETSTVTALLKHGTTPNQKMPLSETHENPHGQCLLGYSILENNTETAVALINNDGIDLNEGLWLSYLDEDHEPTDCLAPPGYLQHKCSFLSYVVYYDRGKIALALLTKPAGSVNCDDTITIKGIYENWPLTSYTVYWKYEEVAVGLLAKGANARHQIPDNAWDSYKNLPLLTYSLRNCNARISVALAVSLTEKGIKIEDAITNIEEWNNWKKIHRLPKVSGVNASANQPPLDVKKEQTALNHSDVAVTITEPTNQTARKDEKRPEQMTELMPPKRVDTNNTDTRVNKLTDAIFLALFADIPQGSGDSKKDHKLSAVYKLMQLTFGILPELTLLANKLNLEKTELKDSKEGKMFVEFARHSLFQVGITQTKVAPKQIPEMVSRKKWFDLLEVDEKQREALKDQIQVAARTYVNTTDKNIAIENIANKVILAIDLKNKIDPATLLKWIKDKLNNECFANVNLEKNPEKLVAFLIKEIESSINDKDIHTSHKPDIYAARINIAVWDWLDDTNQLTGETKQIYDLTNKIWNRLEQLRNRKDPSGKKPSIERFLILDALLNHPSKEHVLQFAKTRTSKDTKGGAELDLVEYVAARKYALETHTDKKFKDTSYDGLSRNNLNQDTYKSNIRKAISDWVVQVVPNEYSVSRLPTTSRTTVSAIDTKDELATPLVFSPKQKNFINAFCRQFEKFYCMYIALDNHWVSRLQDHVDKFAKEAENFAHIKLNAMGYELPLGQIGLLMAKFAVYRKDRQVQKAAERMGFVFGTRSMEENSRFIRFAAEYIAFRYEMQINRLSEMGSGIETVGHCAAERAIQYITAADNHLSVTQPSIWAQAWQAITRFVNEKKYDPDLMNEFKGPISLIIDGVIQGRSEKDTAKAVGTDFGETWVPGGIFRNVGFIVEDEKGQALYTHPKLVTISDVNRDSKEHGLLVYGYCRIRAEELELVKQHGYVKDEKTSIADVIKRFSKPVNQPRLQPALQINPMLPTHTK